MKAKSSFIILLVIALGFFQSAMARNAQYDEEAREAERIAKERKKAGLPVEEESATSRFAGGVKQVSVDSASGFISETAETTAEEPPIVGTLEGARKGTGKILDNTVRGAVKVVTLGQAEVGDYEVVEPEQGTDEPTKIRIKIPGT